MESRLPDGGFQEIGEREHEIIAALGLMALEAGGIVGGRCQLSLGPEAAVLHLAVAKLRRVFGAPAGALLHYDDAVQAASDKRPLASLAGSPLSSRTALKVGRLRTVPFGRGWPGRTCLNASALM